MDWIIYYLKSLKIGIWNPFVQDKIEPPDTSDLQLFKCQGHPKIISAGPLLGLKIDGCKIPL